MERIEQAVGLTLDSLPPWTASTGGLRERRSHGRRVWITMRWISVASRSDTAGDGPWLRARPGRRRGRTPRRRADRLARLDAILALSALAVDAHLPRTQQLLQGAVAEVEEMLLEPTVEPQPRHLLLGDGASWTWPRVPPGEAIAHGAQPRASRP